MGLINLRTFVYSPTHRNLIVKFRVLYYIYDADENCVLWRSQLADSFTYTMRNVCHSVWVLSAAILISRALINTALHNTSLIPQTFQHAIRVCVYEPNPVRTSWNECFLHYFGVRCWAPVWCSVSLTHLTQSDKISPYRNVLRLVDNAFRRLRIRRPLRVHRHWGERD